MKILKYALALSVGAIVGGVIIGALPLMMFLLSGEWSDSSTNLICAGLCAGFVITLAGVTNDIGRSGN